MQPILCKATEHGYLNLGNVSIDDVSARIFDPTYHRFLVLLLAAVLIIGRGTIANLLRTGREKAPEYMSSYHRVFSQRRWSAWALARLLTVFLLDHVILPRPVRLAGYDTATEHPDPLVFCEGRHRDAVSEDAQACIAG